MADYYPLIARAVAGLDKNTGEARRALYERARTALVAQLRGVAPPLEEAEITRERLSLEESIRKVEAEAARQSRFENRPVTAARAPADRRESLSPRPDGAPPAPEPVPDMPGEEMPAEAPAGPAAGKDQPRQEPRFDETPEPLRPEPIDLDAPGAGERKEPRIDMPPRPAGRTRPSGERPSLSEEALKGFRDVLGAAGPAAPASPRPTRTAPAPPAAHDFDRLDAQGSPQIDPEALEALARSAQPVGIEPSPEFSELRPTPPRPRPSQREPEDQEAVEERPRRSLRPWIQPILALLIVLGLCGLAFWKRAEIVAIYHAFMDAPSTHTGPEGSPAPSSRPKIADRIGPGAQDPAVGDAQRGAPGVAQRVVLYEEEPTDPQGRRYLGSVVWRTETISAGPGQPPELAVKADVEIPERRMTMTWSIRRNTDKALPASHTIEIMFNLPQDFPHGGITNVPGILMKQAEQTRGTPLAGLAVKVTAGFFLIGLSAGEAEVQRNVQMLKERPWFDIPIVYNDNRRAILALEKGTPGDRAFADAFAAWKQ